MKEIDISGDNRFDTYTKTRVACRGIVICNGRLLVSRETAADNWLLPGGGLEPDETLPECCTREILEETGYITESIKEFLIINEYYEEYRYISHYFVCRVSGIGVRKLTESERKRGLVPEWIDIRSFADIVSKHREYAAVNEEKRGAYLREYTAITQYLDSLKAAE
ncbi:MAG: NUDIX domain-containing protein [Eubacteriales bacterium]